MTTYNVTGSVTYAHAFDVEVKASSEEEARKYVYENIDKYSNESMSEKVFYHIDNYNE